MPAHPDGSTRPVCFLMSRAPQPTPRADPRLPVDPRGGSPRKLLRTSRTLRSSLAWSRRDSRSWVSVPAIPHRPPWSTTIETERDPRHGSRLGFRPAPQVWRRRDGELVPSRHHARPLSGVSLSHRSDTPRSGMKSCTPPGLSLPVRGDSQRHALRRQRQQLLKEALPHAAASAKELQFHPWRRATVLRGRWCDWLALA